MPRINEEFMLDGLELFGKRWGKETKIINK